MSLAERRCEVMFFFVLSFLVCLSTRDALAAEPLRIGGNGSALGSMKILGAAFEESYPGIRVVVVPSLGTGGGIRAVAKGAIDIGLSGRPMSDAETNSGLEIVEYARTPLILAVGEANPRSNVRRSEFVRVVRGDTGIVSGDQPSRPILRPESDAETLLARQVFPEIGAGRPPGSHATIALTSQDAADLIEKVSGAIGLSTLALIRSENRKMKALSLDGVAPSPKNVANGSYPLLMRLYLVTRRNPAEPVRKFIAFVQSEPGKRLLEESGNYVGERRK